MSQTDIQSWLSSAATVDENGFAGPSWQRDRVLQEWSQALEFAQNKLLESKTSSRVQFLREELLSLAKHGDLNLSQNLDLFKLLTFTYPRYTDPLSRDAVEAVGMEMVRRDELRGTPEGAEDEQKLGITEQILGWLSHEVARLSKASSSSIAPSSLFVLFSWTCGLYTVTLQTNPTFTETHSWRVLVGSMALLLDMLQASDPAKPSLKTGALVRARRSFRTTGDKFPILISTLLAQSKSSQTPLRFIPLLGVAVSVLIRLKNVEAEPASRLSKDLQGEVINLYSSSVLMSKSPVPPHVLAAFHDIIQTYVSTDVFTNTILPTAEKALLRSPEYSLSVITQFFQAYAHTLDTDSSRRIITQAINSTKSSNPVVRAHSIDLFKNVVTTSTDLDSVVTELLSLPKSGKTTGPEHRVALYSMLSVLSSSLSVSTAITQTTLPLLAKETHEPAIIVLAAALPPHLLCMLQNDKPIPSDVVSLIAKEMNNTKPTMRRAFCSLTGNVIWKLEDVASGASLAFAKAVFPALENNLKTASNNPLNSTSGSLDGYIAVATLLGPLTRSKAFNDAISRNATIQSISATSAKPSFLLWDKVYQKITDAEEQLWLLRACEASLSFYNQEILKNQALRVQIGLVFVHVAANSLTPDIRRSVYDIVEKSSVSLPRVTNSTIRDAISVFVSRGPPSTASSSADEQVTWNKHATLSSLLVSSVAFGPEADVAVREESVVEMLILAHHSLICVPSRQTWIDLCQKTSIDPRQLVDAKLDRLLELVLAASVADGKYGFQDASYHSLRIVTFISPATVVPRLMEQIRSDMDPSVVDALTETDLEIWATPEGTAYVDVLSSTKEEVRQTKGKNSEIEKWEADLRKSLANKKTASGPATLTKQQQALVHAQLEKESRIRQHVNTVKQKIQRGLHFVQSLVLANVSEFRPFISSLLALLLDGPLNRGAVLAGPLAFETYLALAQCCSERLEIFRKWVGIAALRSSRPSVVPEELKEEPLGHLITRVFYRLRFLSEQTPFDGATFSYAFPLLQFVFSEGGIATEEAEEALEQVALALDIVKFHIGQFSDLSFPRAQTMERLLHVIRQQPKLSKEASSALVDLGEVISATASKAESDVLLHGLLLQEVYTRNSCLQALQPFDLTDLDWSPEILIACHDDDEQNARLARHIWEDNGLDVPESFLHVLIPFLGHENAYVRSSSAAAIVEGIEHWSENTAQTISALEEHYRDKAKILAPEYDDYGMLVAQSLDRADPWPVRVSISRVFELLAPLAPQTQVVPFFKFLIEDEALGDRTPEVRRGMLSAGTMLIDVHGAASLAGLIAMFEDYLSRPSSANETGDHIKEAVVILFGRLAQHLGSSDPRIPAIMDRLVEALTTPSEQVQIAVSECLPPLVKITRPRLTSLVDKLLDDLLNSPKYATRRGSAYGLAGVLKGTGISGFKEFGIINRLSAATEEKKRYEPRQGVMFAFETLSYTLGRLFEPYIAYILPLLLNCFGDATSDVREATQDAARVLMGNMSGYGVKLILPSLLSGLDEKQWRSKKGSIELLGMMAYCSPRQLSLSLPIVIPRLTDVLTDSHTQVRTAANKSLKQFGEVIENPEIQSLVPVLLKALVDPTKTPNALTSLLKTSFMHYIDHSSLALVVPILERGLRERGADTKKKAAQIVGNLASLTDSKDFVPYLDELLPLVHLVLVDPVPEARATAAKTLGTLVERLGEVNFPDLVPGLLRTLKTDTSGVDRQGAAQGLSEVLSGLGMERLEGLLPDIIANAQSPRATVREGFMSLLVYLPATFGTRFQPHLPKIIPPILSGLSDGEEYVREAAMRAGRMMITNYSSRAIDLLLPELEQGMFDPGWRIRQSSITLVGELLFKVSGISGKPSDLDEDETAVETTTADSSRRALVEVLGVERRDRLLATLYLVRQDGVGVVRLSSIQIWKVLVNNTPRTVREILPELINQIVVLISSDEFEQQEIAARTIAELCRKFGDKIVGEIMANLRTKMTSTDSHTREGVCLALCEIMENSTETQREDHEEEIISMVRTSLVDDEANVRSAAARAFDTLQEHIGAKAIDQTIPTLLEALRQPGKGSGTALQALREVMNVRASTVFPVLIPTLTATPMSVFNAHALASLVTVAGGALSKRLTVILAALVKVIEDDKDEELLEAADEALRALLTSIEDAEGLNTLMMVLFGWAKHDSPKRRISAYNFVTIFFAESELDSAYYRVDWIRQFITSMEDPNVGVHTAAWNALDVFVKSIPKDELEPLAVPLRRSIESTGPPGHYVPGFSLPKGVSPTVPIIIAGLTSGTNEQREQAAYAIGDLVERTEESAIKPFVVPFTGPLIRVATQATTYPPAVKTAILSALTSMLQRIPAFVKPFFPQLQRTFVKSASDPASIIVRNKAGQGLGVLMKNQPRVDPVVTELITGARNSDTGIATSLVLALAHVVSNATTNVGEKAREACLELVTDAFSESHDEHYVQAIAQLVASLSVYIELLEPLIEMYLSSGTPASPLSSHIIAAVLSPDEDIQPDRDEYEQNVFQKLGLLRTVAQKVLESAANERPNIARPAREARELLREIDDDDLVGLF